MNQKLKKISALLLTLLLLTFTITGCSETANHSDAKSSDNNTSVSDNSKNTKNGESSQDLVLSAFNVSEAGTFAGSPYVSINNNIPYFSDADKSRTDAFETYSDLDSLGRCGVAYANICKELMPTEKRGAIGSVKPSGWQSVKYDNVDGKYLYNRCHLIGFQLAGENANEKNLITGTRYLNIQGMLPFENMVTDYVKETGNHVLYRVTPVFEGDNLVASGVLMEGYSVEDKGDGILFCIYAYNAQPGISIDYATGKSSLLKNGESYAVASAQTQAPAVVTEPQTEAPTPAPTQPQTEAPTQPQTAAPTPAPTQPQTEAVTEVPTQPQTEVAAPIQSNTATYVLNTSTKKFHNPSCYTIDKMNDSNKAEVTDSRDSMIAQGYELCKKWNP